MTSMAPPLKAVVVPPLARDSGAICRPSRETAPSRLSRGWMGALNGLDLAGSRPATGYAANRDLYRTAPLSSIMPPRRPKSAGRRGQAILAQAEHLRTGAFQVCAKRRASARTRRASPNQVTGHLRRKPPALGRGATFSERNRPPMVALGPVRAVQHGIIILHLPATVAQKGQPVREWLRGDGKCQPCS